jgi:hypothetical protein
MKHIWLALPFVFGLTACSKVDDGSQREAGTSAPAADARKATAPAIDSSVAPGVAFDLSFGFALPEHKIAAVQEGHAALCGRMGTTHCRVTSVHFDKLRGGNVTADMTFLLDPALALGFARDATTLVENADGTLDTSRVAGEDVGKTIVANDKNAQAIRAELARIDAQLRIPGLSKETRGTLVTQSSDLRAQLRAMAGEREAKVESLATTPVRFGYDVAPAPIGDAWIQGLGAGAISGTSLVSMLAYLIGALGPFAVMGGIIWWAVRGLRGRKLARIAVPTQG